MRKLFSRRVKVLLAANLVAWATLYATGGLLDAQWTTFCPPQARGCQCLQGKPFLPDGCYEDAVEGFRCCSNEFCNNPE